MGCAFWGSDERPLSAPCYSFNLCHAGRLLLHVTKPCQRVNFSDRHFSVLINKRPSKRHKNIIWENYFRCPHTRTTWTLHDSNLDSYVLILPRRRRPFSGIVWVRHTPLNNKLDKLRSAINVETPCIPSSVVKTRYENATPLSWNAAWTSCLCIDL